MVFAGDLFSQHPTAPAHLGLCDQPPGLKGSREGPDGYVQCINIIKISNFAMFYTFYSFN